MKQLYIFWGKVIAGQKRGKKLGFPTANVRLHKKYTAATFIGSAKTFGETEYKAETYILNFNQNLYGKWITIRLFKKLRDNKKFDSEKALVLQMKEDINKVKER